MFSVVYFELDNVWVIKIVWGKIDFDLWVVVWYVGEFGRSYFLMVGVVICYNYEGFYVIGVEFIFIGL